MILAESCSEGSAGFPPTAMVRENLMVDGKVAPASLIGEFCWDDDHWVRRVAHQRVNVD